MPILKCIRSLAKNKTLHWKMAKKKNHTNVFRPQSTTDVLVFYCTCLQHSCCSCLQIIPFRDTVSISWNLFYWIGSDITLIKYTPYQTQHFKFLKYTSSLLADNFLAWNKLICWLEPKKDFHNTVCHQKISPSGKPIFLGPERMQLLKSNIERIVD